MITLFLKLFLLLCRANCLAHPCLLPPAQPALTSVPSLLPESPAIAQVASDAPHSVMSPGLYFCLGPSLGFQDRLLNQPRDISQGWLMIARVTRPAMHLLCSSAPAVPGPAGLPPSPFVLHSNAIFSVRTSWPLLRCIPNPSISPLLL